MCVWWRHLISARFSKVCANAADSLSFYKRVHLMAEFRKKSHQKRCQHTFTDPPQNIATQNRETSSCSLSTQTNKTLAARVAAPACWDKQIHVYVYNIIHMCMYMSFVQIVVRVYKILYIRCNQFVRTTSKWTTHRAQPCLGAHSHAHFILYTQTYECVHACAVLSLFKHAPTRGTNTRHTFLYCWHIFII